MPATSAVNSDGTFDTVVLMQLDELRDPAGHRIDDYDFVLTPIAALGLLNPTPPAR